VLKNPGAGGPEEVYNRAITEAKSLVEHIENKTLTPAGLKSVQEIIELVEDNNGDITILADKGNSRPLSLLPHG